LADPQQIFQGTDYWRAYEFSWIGPESIPQVAALDLAIPCSSPNLVESKSLKLYLNGFAGETFENNESLTAVLRRDLEGCIGSAISCSLEPLQNLKTQGLAIPEGMSLNDVRPLTQDPQPLADRLTFDSSRTASLQVCTDLFRSLCPVTGQPDWASIVIDMEGAALELRGLQTYLLGYRNHAGFHEQCIERIYQDIWRSGVLEKLEVTGMFTRRGGIEICPFRSSYREKLENRIRTPRQ
jgi:7-cyano-7-deazaguanine reductase